MQSKYYYCILCIFQKYLFCNLWDRKYRQIMWRRQGSEKQQDTFLEKAMFCGKIMFFTIFIIRYWNCSSRSCEKSKLIGNNSWKCGFWTKSQGNAKYEKGLILSKRKSSNWLLCRNAYSRKRICNPFSQQKRHSFHILEEMLLTFCIIQLQVSKLPVRPY